MEDQKEEWKSLEGFSGYLFSNMGQIIRLRDNKIEPTTLSGIPQYKYVHLVPDGGKRSLYRLHRLIAQAWIPNPDSYKIVDHMNRDRLDNRVENLRWTCNSGNQKNTEAAYFARYKGFWVHVKTFYRNDNAAYAYAYNNKHLNLSLEDIEDMRKTSQHSKMVEWEGENVLLFDLCEKYGKDYNSVVQKYSNGHNTIYSAMFYDRVPRVSYELEGSGGVKYQFSSKDEIAEHLGVFRSRVDENLDLCNGSLVELRKLIALYQPKETRTLYTIDGVSKFKEDWIRYYETTDTRVRENMSKYKIPFEEAVQMPVQRVRKILLDGEVILVKDMWVKFGFQAKACNTKKAHWQTTFKQTLERLGVDVSEIEITPI